MSALESPALTDAQALSTLLVVEGFLLAAISLAITLDAPNQVRPRSFRVIKPTHIVRGAACVLVVLAIGAVSAWCQIFTGGEFEGFTRAVIAGALLLAVVVQPVIAVLLAFGSKTQ